MRDRPKRATQGKRMRQLIGEEQDQDIEFWGHDVWNEDDNDDFAVGSGDDVADEFDSDFDKVSEGNATDSQGEETAVRKEERKAARAQPKSAGTYRDPKTQPTRAKRARKSEPVNQSAPEPIQIDDEPTPAPPPAPSHKATEQDKAATPGSTSRSLRKSTRASTVEKNAQRERVAKQKEVKGGRKKPAGEGKAKDEGGPLTQEEMLAEAALTEQFNMAYLKELLRCEDEERQRAVKAPIVKTYPYVTYTSTPSGNTVTFNNFPALPREVKSKPIPYPKPKLCAVTNQPARYQLPSTRTPFANVQAYQTLTRNK